MAGDPTAPADLATTHLDDLVRALRWRFPWQDPSLLETVAIDLLLDLAEAPVRYDPTRGSLHAYLTMAAAAQGILKVAHDVPVYSADGNALQCFNPLNG